MHFYGKRDKTLLIRKESGKFRCEEINEIHYCIIKELISEYMGHISVENGPAQTIVSEILEFKQTSSLFFFATYTVINCRYGIYGRN